jgi:hypothetical protein
MVGVQGEIAQEAERDAPPGGLERPPAGSAGRAGFPPDSTDCRRWNNPPLRDNFVTSKKRFLAQPHGVVVN